MTRAEARPADLGHWASDQSAGPLTTAFMFFSKGSAAVLVLVPPSTVSGWRCIHWGVLDPPSWTWAYYTAARLSALGGDAHNCSTAPARDSSQTGTRRTGWRIGYAGTKDQEERMPIVGVMGPLTTNGMRNAPTLRGGEGRVVGAAELSLATGFAAVSTTLRMNTDGAGIAVAELVVASCFARTLIPFLELCGSLAAVPTTNGAWCVAGVAYLLLPSTLPQTSATPK